MRSKAFIIFSKKGITKLVKTKPSLKRGQYAVKIEFSVPDSVFQEAPIPEVFAELKQSDVLISPPSVEITPVSVADQLVEDLEKGMGK